MQIRIPRLRWSDPKADDPATPVDWRWAALITATLFLNFVFCERHGLDLVDFGGLPVDAGVLAVGSVLLIALFFLGPAMASHASKRPVLGLMEISLGSIPALVLRLCCAVFLIIWISDFLGWPAWALVDFDNGRGSAGRSAIIAGLLAFLLFTGLQSTRTSAKLALFNNKLGLAVLLAALIRVHAGLTAIPAGFSVAGREPLLAHLWQGLSRVAFYIAPFGLLASSLGFRSAGRKQITLIASVGLALPLFAALFLSAVISMAIGPSGHYQPSLQPTVGMALWAHVARNAVPPRVLVALVTTFGVARFGLRALVDCGPAHPRRNLKWALFGSLIAAVPWLSIHHYDASVTAASTIAATCLTVTAAVLTADAIAARNPVKQVRGIDWIGTVALALGLGTALCLPGRYVWGNDNWWYAWLLPSYGVAFVVCLVGRTAQKLSLRPR